jgi:hypothetical protein
MIILYFLLIYVFLNLRVLEKVINNIVIKSEGEI